MVHRDSRRLAGCGARKAGRRPFPTFLFCPCGRRSKAFSQSPIIKLRRLKMIDDAAVKASAAKATYKARPWLKHYASYVKPEITPGFASALEMFLQTVQALPEQPAIYYFDRAISYGELDRPSTPLAPPLPHPAALHPHPLALS